MVTDAKGTTAIGAALVGIAFIGAVAATLEAIKEAGADGDEVIEATLTGIMLAGATLTGAAADDVTDAAWGVLANVLATETVAVLVATLAAEITVL